MLGRHGKGEPIVDAVLIKVVVKAVDLLENAMGVV